MKNSYQISQPPFAIIVSLIASIFLVSCGSFESVSYHDGVYGESSNVRPLEQTDQEEQPLSYQNDSGSYYQALFAQKAADYDTSYLEKDSVFTDVDSYSSQSYDQTNPDYTSSYGGGNPAWGENPSQVTINYIDNGWRWNNWGWNNWGWNNWGWNNWGWNNGFGNFGWGGGFGWGWNRFGWNRGFGGFGLGWNNWGWNNWGWNGGLGWAGGWGWNNWGTGNIAFANNNRGYRTNFNNGAFGRTSTIGRNTTRRNVGRGTDGNSRGRATSRSTSRSSNSTISRRSSSRNSSATNSRSSSRTNSGVRSSRSSSSRSSGSVRSSRSSSSRSSGSMRSSGSSRSSSGSRSSGGRSSGRRG